MYLRVLPVGRPQTQARCMCVPRRQFLLNMVPELELYDTSLTCKMDVEDKVSQSTGSGQRMGKVLEWVGISSFPSL